MSESDLAWKVTLVLGLVEKGEFEPRVTAARERLVRLEAEASELADEEAAMQGLRLVLGRLEEFLVFGRPLVVGASRKSFLGRVLQAPDPGDRLEGSLAAAVIAALTGAHVLRVHDVAATRRAVLVADAVLHPERYGDQP